MWALIVKRWRDMVFTFTMTLGLNGGYDVWTDKSVKLSFTVGDMCDTHNATSFIP